MAIKRKRHSVGSNTSGGIRKTKVHPLRNSWADLPSDIFTNILLKLPIKSILICKFTCKSWFSIISDPHFAQMHLECAPISALVRLSNPRHVSRTLHLLDFDEFKSNEAHNLSSDNDSGHVPSSKYCPRPDCDNHMELALRFKLPLHDSKMVPVVETRKRMIKCSCKTSTPKDKKFDVVNSCNGLFCLCDPFERNPLAVCNPIIGEFIGLPQSENDKLMRVHVYSGFGYLKRTNEYKIFQGCGNSITLEPILRIPSLIRLKDAVKGDNIEVLNVHSRCATFKLPEDKEVLYLTKAADPGDMSIMVLNF